MPLIQGRKRRAAAEEDEPQEQSPEPQPQRRRTDAASDDEDFATGAYGGATQGDGVDEMAKKLVRLALACEFQRRPIRRGDISEKVLGTNGRQFKHVWNKAQSNLRDVFGMEMRELPAKEKVTLQQKRAAQKNSTQSKSTTTTSWMLTSILPSQFRDPRIIPPPAAPNSAEESTYTAIYSLIVAAIALSGGSLPDAKMDRWLKRLGMEDTTPVSEYDKTEKLMKRLERDGYIVRIRESTGTGEDDIYWTVGPRGKIEVGDDGVRGLVKAVHGDLDEDEDQELERRLERSLGIAERQALQDRRAEEQHAAAAAKQQKGKRKKGRRGTGQEEEQDEDDPDEDEEIEYDEDDD